MPKRNDIDTIFIIGAGPIVIGQACEFDYSGTQACKALKGEGYRVALVNSNPATIMTDPATADTTYIEPITPEVVARILRKEREERPNERIALLPTMGGQTALNTGLALQKMGVLAELNIVMIGAKAEVIEKAEDRELFRLAMEKIGLECPKARLVHNLAEGLDALKFIGGLPAIIRPSFTLGGRGGGIAYNEDDFLKILNYGLQESPVHSVLVEESVLGWKEFEMEVVRDKADNAIIICSIENIDPMGIHTGDSITIAPALTLTDKEYQIMRNASLAVLREIGVETGGSNVQFAINPDNGRMVVIEMNPRVSRSSALASKATGFPIAKVAALLAVGYTLNELVNDITKTTPASFEPSIDYIVTKIPRFAFEKFVGANNTLTTSMKSVGEAMAIGRNFQESFQKALISLETGISGFNDFIFDNPKDINEVRAKLTRPTPERILYIGEALRQGYSVQFVHDLTKIDKWFLHQFAQIIGMESQITRDNMPDVEFLRGAKRMGYSDKLLAKRSGMAEGEIRKLRHKHGIRPVFKRIDTCAGEFKSTTAYSYSSYELPPFDFKFHGQFDESNISTKKKIVILGGGPNRIGQGIEFDYCCVHACYALKEMGFETIMINCNPETVSTDYDTANRLYFEPLSLESVLEILLKEQEEGQLLGVIVQFGGQTPLKLANELHANKIPILGTSVESIDLAEDRQLFKALLEKYQLKQPHNGTAFTKEEAIKTAETIGYPVVIRPSFVLGGRAMEIVRDRAGLERYIDVAVKVSGKNPVLIDSYLSSAIEVDVDALCDGKDVFVAGIMEHIEEAGVHSGDSACSLPAYSLDKNILQAIKIQTEILAKALQVVGLMNVQYAVKDGEIYILEVNPRASRTVPFVAKAIGFPLAAVAAQIMAGKRLRDFKLPQLDAIKHIAVKEAVFPFDRFLGCEVILSPEMRSTGEVMGIANNFAMAFAKAQLAAGVKLPIGGNAFISVKDSDKQTILAPCQELIKLGFTLYATAGTAEFLRTNKVEVTRVNKVSEGQPNIVDLMINGKIAVVFNTTEGNQSLEDSRHIRQTAVMRHIPYFTTIRGIKSAIAAIYELQIHPIEVQSLQEYTKNSG